MKMKTIVRVKKRNDQGFEVNIEPPLLGHQESRPSAVFRGRSPVEQVFHHVINFDEKYEDDDDQGDEDDDADDQPLSLQQ